MVPFTLPMNFQLIGSSQSGKSEFIKKMILNSDKVFKNPPSRIIYVYTVWSERFEELENLVEFTRSIPSNDELIDFYNKERKSTLLILDDCMDMIDKQVARMAFATGHHCNLSLVLTCQVVFPKNPHLRDVSSNVHCFILFKNLRNFNQIKTLASQIYPGKTGFFMDSYQKAVKADYGYLVVQLNCPEKYALRTNIFPPDYTLVYLPKNSI